MVQKGVVANEQQLLVFLTELKSITKSSPLVTSGLIFV